METKKILFADDDPEIREVLRLLLTIRANVDRIMGYDRQEKEAEATRHEEQR